MHRSRGRCASRVSPISRQSKQQSRPSFLDWAAPKQSGRFYGEMATSFRCFECETSSLLTDAGGGGRYGTDAAPHQNLQVPREPRWQRPPKWLVLAGCALLLGTVFVLTCVWYASETRPDDHCVCKGTNCTGHCEVRGDHPRQAKVLLLTIGVALLAFLICIYAWKEREARKKQALVLVFLRMQPLAEVDT